MFKKTRLRIFALILGAATVIITLMLTTIYAANASYNYDRGLSLLESYMENGGNFHPGFAPEPRGMRPGMKDNRDKMFRLSNFYSVFYNLDGEAVKINCDGGVLYSEEEILEIADAIRSGGETRGLYNKMPFLVKSDSFGTVVALIDSTMETDNSGRLFRSSVMTGVFSWTVIAVLAWFFSGKIVKPLEESDKKQKQFISDAGHELKTPISVISANADLLSMEIGENKWLSNIQYENQRMGSLVSQLLELVRAENQEPAKEQLDFSRLVSGGTLPFESVAFENGHTLTTDIEDGIFVEGNTNQLSQLVSILIDNAISYGTPETEVAVRLSSDRHHAVFSVVNAGQPIPAEIQNRLFERFYRADEARTDESGHYGLGLAIAKAIVTAHGGDIGVNCDKGLIEFRVTLPN